MHKKLLTTREASEYLGGRVAPKTLQEWRCARKGPPWVSLNGRIFYKPEDLDDWIEENRKDPQTA